MKSKNFVYRGIVEGFYGKPFTHEDRLWWIQNLALLDMNVYLYAPKDDAYHRQRWREPYPQATIIEFEELIKKGRELGVTVGFAISPGNSIIYSDEQHRRDLLEKFQKFQELGSTFLCLALDDVPTSLQNPEDRSAYSSLGAAHVSLANNLQQALGKDGVFWLIPTDYAGNEATDNLKKLGKELLPGIEVGWTGGTVLASEILFKEAEQRTELLGRKPLIWDNVPVADGPMKSALHLGPYLGRDKRLGETVSGLLLNPMNHARASYITISTAADYMKNPDSYNAEEAWREAVHHAGRGAEKAFSVFASAHRFGPMSPQEREPIIEELWNQLDSLKEVQIEDTSDFRHAIEDRLQVESTLGKHLLDRELLGEIKPWLVSHHTETLRLNTACNLLIDSLQTQELIELLLKFMSFESNLKALSLPIEISYGPRKIFYPQLATDRDGIASLSPEQVLFRDNSLVDDIITRIEDKIILDLTSSGGQNN